MASTSKARPMGDVPDAFLGLLQAQVKLGQQLFEDFTGTKAPAFTDPWTAWQTAGRQLSAIRPVCDVPPPCWMPRRLGDCISYTSSCSTARVRIVVTNCDRVARAVHVRTEGLEGITVTPASAELGPMRRATFEISYHVPDGTERGTQLESLIWVEGCRQHVLNWTISVGAVALDSTYEVVVDDCPDYRHHWYDHFYCMRPCPAGRSTQNG